MAADESRYPVTLSCLQECSAYTSKVKLIVNEMSTVTKCNDLSFEFTHCSLATKFPISLCKTATENTVVTVVATVQSKQKSVWIEKLQVFLYVYILACPETNETIEMKGWKPKTELLPSAKYSIRGTVKTYLSAIFIQVP